MCLAHGQQRSDVSEARACGPRYRGKQSTIKPLRSLVVVVVVVVVGAVEVVVLLLLLLLLLLPIKALQALRNTPPLLGAPKVIL